MALLLEPDVAPVRATERMDVLDAVRGAAVLGILLANILAFSGLAFVPAGYHASLPLPTWHEPSLFAILFLVEGKFYSLFSFLFGVGFAVFIQRAALRGGDAVALFKRRLTGLLLIGLAHSLLLWMGDILATYAVLGFALIPFVRRDDRTVLRWAAGLLLLPIVLYAIGVAAAAVMLPGAGPEPAAAGGLPPFLVTALNAFASGSYLDVVRGNVVFTLANAVRRLMLMFFPRILGMFLLGFYVGRRGIFADLEAHRPLLHRVLAWGLIVGLPLSFAGAWLEGNNMGVPNTAGLIETVVKTFGVPALSMGYAAALCLLFMHRAALRRAFASVGQTALSNYLLQSVAGVVVFYGIGLGLFQRVPLAFVMAGAVLFFAIQLGLSRAWLAAARFGPAEWLWRMLTYGRRVPLLSSEGARRHS